MPGADGRAGMAAIVVDDGFDLKSFAEHLARRLPIYAVPVFVRLCDGLDATETFKQKKQQLIRQNFDPSIVSDPLLVRDPETGEYGQLDANAFARIAEGAIRL